MVRRAGTVAVRQQYRAFVGPPKPRTQKRYVPKGWNRPSAKPRLETEIQRLLQEFAKAAIVAYNEDADRLA